MPCVPGFPITILFFPRMGGEVLVRTFMQHCDSIKINTNEMFTSKAAGAPGDMAHCPPPEETLAFSSAEETLLSNSPLHAQ